MIDFTKLLEEIKASPYEEVMITAPHTGVVTFGPLKVGDKVLYSKYAGSEFKIDGKDVTIMRQSDVLAVVEK